MSGFLFFRIFGSVSVFKLPVTQVSVLFSFFISFFLGVKYSHKKRNFSVFLREYFLVQNVCFSAVFRPYFGHLLTIFRPILVKKIEKKTRKFSVFIFRNLGSVFNLGSVNRTEISVFKITLTPLALSSSGTSSFRIGQQCGSWRLHPPWPTWWRSFRKS